MLKKQNSEARLTYILYSNYFYTYTEKLLQWEISPVWHLSKSKFYHPKKKGFNSLFMVLTKKYFV